MAIDQLDHVLIKVGNLTEAVTDFRRMGFTTYYGSSPENKAYNAMVYFEDGTFIELVDTNRFPLLFRKLLQWKMLKPLGFMLNRVTDYVLAENGPIDYCVHSSNIASDHKDLGVYFHLTKIRQMNRMNHLRKKVSWSLFSTSKKVIPFVISDYTPEKLPKSNAICHDNDACGIGELNLSIDSNTFKDATYLLSLFYLKDIERIHIRAVRFKLKTCQINYHQSFKTSIDSLVINLRQNHFIIPDLWDKYHLIPNYIQQVKAFPEIEMPEFIKA